MTVALTPAERDRLRTVLADVVVVTGGSIKAEVRPTNPPKHLRDIAYVDLSNDFIQRLHDAIAEPLLDRIAELEKSEPARVGSMVLELRSHTGVRVMRVEHRENSWPGDRMWMASPMWEDRP